MYLYTCIGLVMGVFTFIMGVYLDIYLDLNSLIKLKSNKKLYLEIYESSFINLIIVSPIYFTFSIFFVKNSFYIDFIEVIKGVFFHNLTYFIMHFYMHNNNYLKKIHNFHHKFKTDLVPSVGNAVSLEEMCIVYLSPFMTFCIINQPYLGSFIVIILIISIFNLLIHSTKLSMYNWLPFLVTPNDHNHHHKMSKGVYSAPLFKINNIKINNLS